MHLLQRLVRQVIYLPPRIFLLLVKLLHSMLLFVPKNIVLDTRVIRLFLIWLLTLGRKRYGKLTSQTTLMIFPINSRFWRGNMNFLRSLWTVDLIPANRCHSSHPRSPIFWKCLLKPDKHYTSYRKHVTLPRHFFDGESFRFQPGTSKWPLLCLNGYHSWDSFLHHGPGIMALGGDIHQAIIWFREVLLDPYVFP